MIYFKLGFISGATFVACLALYFFARASPNLLLSQNKNNTAHTSNWKELSKRANHCNVGERNEHKH